MPRSLQGASRAFILPKRSDYPSTPTIDWRPYQLVRAAQLPTWTKARIPRIPRLFHWQIWRFPTRTGSPVLYRLKTVRVKRKGNTMRSPLASGF